MKLFKSSLMAVALGYVLALSGTVSAQENDDRVVVAEANFEAADADGDGALDRDEFKAFINANAESNLGRAKQIRRFRAYGRAFSRLDADGSKSVTWEEIQIAQSGE
ncbi:MAG: EF-hand domain-containing protein [Hyphomonadaceae bacterium]|nr:EF-hand domain-containing protein [Hyphomonadaceae bacterium]